MNLTEKHRPRSLSELVGQDEILLQLRDYLDDPVSTAMIFSGPTGTGKTSAAKALAAELGCDLDSLCGGCIELASGDHAARGTCSRRR